MTDGTHTDYYRIESISGNTLTVTPYDDDGLGHSGSGHSGYPVGSSVKPVKGRCNPTGKFGDIGIKISDN